MTNPSPDAASTAKGGVLIFAGHRTADWWKHIGQNLGYARCVILTDRRGAGDRSLTDAFYAACRRHEAAGSKSSPLLDEAEVADVIARCRVLRWFPVRRARAMALGMAEAVERALLEERPEVILGFPIDRYVTDVLARRARAHGVAYHELTASALPGMSMLMSRGQLEPGESEPSETSVDAGVRHIADPLFTPSYVQGISNFSTWRFLKVYFYFRLRGLVFWLWSRFARDPLNLHYVDAQGWLGHKPRLRDRRVVHMIHQDWQSRLEATPMQRRAFLALQLFPEASIDYWINDPSLVDHENALVEGVQALADAGWCVVVKDHPLQFGFRQTEFIERLIAIPGVILVPYEVSGNALLSMTGASVTCTGTLGMQAALCGKPSATVPTYYVTPGDFITFTNRAELANLPARLAAAAALDTDATAARQRRIIANLLKGSFEGDYFSFQNFDPASPNPAATRLALNLGLRMKSLDAAHHQASRPKPEHDHEGSPYHAAWGRDGPL